MLVNRLKWLLPVVVSVAIAAVVYAAAITTYPRPPILADARGYTLTAMRLLDRRTFSFGVEASAPSDQPNAAVTPGYVVFLAGIYGVMPRSSGDATATALAVQPVVQNVQFVLALCVVALVAGCGLALGGKKLAYLAGFLAVLYLPFGWSATVALSEGLAAALAALQLLLALLLVRREPRRPAVLLVAFGVVSAAFALVRPVTALWLLVPFVYLAVRRTYSWKRLGQMLALTLAGALVLMAPWWVRNVVVLHRFVALSEGAGNPAFRSTGGYPLSPDEQVVYDSADANGKDSEAAVASYRLKRELLTEPFTLIGARLATAYDVVKTPWMAPYGALWEERYDPAAPRITFGAFPLNPSEPLLRAMKFVVAYQAFLLLAGLAGLLFVVRAPRLVLVASVPVYFVLVHFFTLFLDRYFFPAMPAVVVLAAAGVFGVTRSASGLYRRLSPAPAEKR